ncbi:MAG: epimerase, partial [Proteobacteria bacterium]|nr:epimerase [Pseudomonadota bacterium]
VTHLIGDRDPNESDLLVRIAGQNYDAVIDMCGMVPRLVRVALDAVGDRPHYTLVSTCSVYSDTRKPGVDESAPVHPVLARRTEEIDGDTYGPLKVACENEVRAVHGERAQIVRPGLIVGPRDPTDRFTYWPVRLTAGGCALVPGPAGALVQGIDGRDLAAFVLAGAEQRRGGTFNAVGEPISMGSLIELCQGPSSEVEWVEAAWLEDQEVEPWSDLPVWVGTDPDNAGFGQISNRKAVEAGLNLRPVAETVADTVAWFAAERGGRDALEAGIDIEREAELLLAWRDHKASVPSL